VSALDWDTQYTYDNHNDASINWSKWENSSSGFDPDITESAGYLNVEISGRVDPNGAVAGLAEVSSIEFPSYSSIKNITIHTVTSEETYACNSNDLRYLSVMGKVISLNVIEDKIWTFVRNGTDFNYLKDSVYQGTFTPIDSVVKIHVSCDSIPDKDSPLRHWQISMDYEYYSLGNGSITITQNSPTTSEGVYNQNVSFNITSNTSINNLSNITLYIDDVVNETINISGTINTTTFNENLSSYDLGNHNYSVYVCDTAGNCKFSDTITFELQPFKIESQTYNSSTYETSTESFLINVTANSSLTDVRLHYDGTSYTTTQSGTIYSRTLQVPTISTISNKTFYWNFTYAGSHYTSLNYKNFTYAGSHYTSLNYNQTINPILLSICNATNTVPYINLSFKDEDDLSLINATIDASTWTFWLGDGSITKELLFSNTSLNYNYSFCFSPGNRTLYNTRSVQFSSESYPQRTYDSSTALTNTTLDKILYLLSSTDGIYSTIQVIDGNLDYISGVEVTVERQFSGVWTVVGQSNTDASGAVTFWVNPDYNHRYTFDKDGCTSFTVIIKPTQTTYTATINCGESTTEIYVSPIDGLKYFRSPASGVLTSGEHNFTFQTVSSKGNIVKVLMQIVNRTGDVVASATSGCTPDGCTISTLYTVLDDGNLKGRYYVDVGDGYILIEADAHWVELDFTEQEGTLTKFIQNAKGLFDKWQDDESEGDNTSDFNRFVFIFFMMSIFIALFNKYTGYDSSNPGAFLIFMTVVVLLGSMAGYPSSEGFFYLDNFTDSYWINNYIFAFYMILILTSHYIGVNLQKNR